MADWMQKLLNRGVALVKHTLLVEGLIHLTPAAAVDEMRQRIPEMDGESFKMFCAALEGKIAGEEFQGANTGQERLRYNGQDAAYITTMLNHRAEQRAQAQARSAQRIQYLQFLLAQAQEIRRTAPSPVR